MKPLSGMPETVSLYEYRRDGSLLNRKAKLYSPGLTVTCSHFFVWVRNLGLGVMFIVVRVEQLLSHLRGSHRFVDSESAVLSIPVFLFQVNGIFSRPRAAQGPSSLRFAEELLCTSGFRVGVVMLMILPENVLSNDPDF